MKTQKLLGEYIEGPVTYELSQICGQVYLFSGYLLQDKHKYQLERILLGFSSHDYREVADPSLANCLSFPKRLLG